MYKFLILIFFTGFANSLVAQEISMTPTEIAAFKSQVQLSSQNMQTIASDFIQYKHFSFLENDIETSGKMFYKKPDKVKWEYTKPYKYSAIFNNETLLINDGGSKTKVDIGNNALFKKMNQLIISSVKGAMFSDTDFIISFLKTKTYNKVIFMPKDKKMASFIASFELFFNKSDGHVIEVKMVEPSKDYTHIIFKNRTINTPLNDSVFSN